MLRSDPWNSRVRLAAGHSRAKRPQPLFPGWGRFFWKGDVSAPSPGTTYAGPRWSTLAYVEKVRPQFLSLRQLAHGWVFSRRIRWQLSPAAAAISNLSSGLPTGRAALLFSARPVSLRTSGLHPLGTVPEIRSFRVTYEPQQKVVRPFLSDIV